MSMKLRELQVVDSGSRLEHELHVYGGTYSIDSLRDPFLQTEAADLLNGMDPRFKDNGYVWDDPEKFIEHMGMDVQPLQHGPYQSRTVAIPMVEAQADVSSPQSLSQDFAERFIAHHVQHDDHEGLFAQRLGMTHDKGFNKKSELDEAEEYALWTQLQNEIFGETAQQHIEAIAGFAPPNCPDSFERKFWNISERIGYLMTALRAWDVASNVDYLKPVERRKSQRLALEVTNRHLSIVEAVRGEIVYADDVLSGFTAQFSEMKRTGMIK